MEITFELIDGLYTAEFEVKSNCNIHVEREGKGSFFILQRGTKTGKYAVVSEEDYNKTTIDVDMLGSIYPKYIKVTSTSMPTYAEVNFAEEGGGIDPNDPESEYFTEYLNFREMSQNAGVTEISTLGVYDVKNESEQGVEIYPAAAASDIFGENTSYLAIMPNRLIYLSGEPFSIKSALEEYGLLEAYNSIPRITKEEFYNLEV